MQLRWHGSRENLHRRRDGLRDAQTQLAERLAGFFAAKEATRKAFGHAIPWRCVGVAHERSGKPTIELRDLAEPLMRRRGVRAIHLTITHTATAAAALVILES